MIALHTVSELTIWIPIFMNTLNLEKYVVFLKFIQLFFIIFQNEIVMSFCLY